MVHNFKLGSRAITPIGYAVHTHGTSAVFDESVIQVLIEDESAGPYILLRQVENLTNKEGEVRLDLDELEAVVRVARRLIRAQPSYVPSIMSDHRSILDPKIDYEPSSIEDPASF